MASAMCVSLRVPPAPAGGAAVASSQSVDAPIAVLRVRRDRAAQLAD